ncbi:tagaturonate epimerase family protein [Planctomicrobium piriforme]|uniref:Tagaturonate/fructuronate epimerase n=1 Tax=Planctomicrobium piriforme TaxID=1576369 RepID=A0A1I3E8I4_9PLAN|nr:tagaturonate epimerase family protein [Planctomicrobium piriforme]SFH95265.1 tagaturonate epimerase [Planctomicrobium piriforme]
MALISAANSRPVALGLAPSFGFGDRLGLATPGHIAALRKAGGEIRGIFAQQSIREMARTRRTAPQVMQAAVVAIEDAKLTDPWGADADHLKTHEDVTVTADAGFVFFTIDPSGHVDQKADNYDEATVLQKFEGVKEVLDWVDTYSGRTVQIQNGPKIEFDRLSVQRAAVKYGRAIEQTVELAEFIQAAAKERRQPAEIELSVDETDQPTSLAEHYIIADQLRRRNVRVVSLAPRFIGELEKGVDYKGDLTALGKSLNDHAAIARELGPYKLSLHSGSDKLSMYGLLAKATKGQFHVKTAGTSYLEALRVVARCAPEEFRRIVEFSRGRYDIDKATYHVSATVSGVPGLDQIKNPDQLESVYLEKWCDVPAGKGFTEPGRQILHCTFGSVLTHEEFGPLVHQILRENPGVYSEVLEEHFVRHLQALNG